MKRLEKETAARKAEAERLQGLLQAVPSGVCDTSHTAQFLAAMEPVIDQLAAMCRSAPLPPERSPGATTACLNALAAWFTAHGGVLHESVAPSLLPGFGAALCVRAQAAKGVAEDELVVSVPRSLVLSESTALRVDAITALFGGDAVAAQFPETLVALQLLYEHKRVGASSHWAPFIAALPERFATPLFWSLSDFCALRGSPALYESLMAVKAAATQFCHLFHELEKGRGGALRFLPPHTFTWPLFAWALSAVMTRKNRVPVLPDADADLLRARRRGGARTRGGGESEQDEEQTMVCLIPVWDLHNHEPGRITTFAVPRTGTVECRAMRCFAPGEQVFIHYGDRPNMQLLSHNGFVLSGAPNPADIVLVSRPAFAGDDEALQKKKQELLAQFVPREVGPYAFFVATHTSEPSPALMAALRVQAMTADEMATLPDVVPDLTATKLSDSNEERAKRKLAEACLRQLAGYPTRFADDCGELVAARAAHTTVRCATQVQRDARVLCLLEKYGLMRAAGLLKAFPGRDTDAFDFGVFECLCVEQQRAPAEAASKPKNKKAKGKK